MASQSLLSLAILFLTITIAEAKDFLVGGSTGAWEVPATTADTLNKWAEANHFQVGDSLVWKYDSNSDSVLQVTREAYMSCTTVSPITEHNDGSTKVTLQKPGAYYFISGAKGACEEGEKLIVVVMAPRHHRFGGFSPSPAPAGYDGPAVAPTSASPMAVMSGMVEALIVLGLVWMIV